MLDSKSKNIPHLTYTGKNVSIIKINNIKHALHTRLISLSSFVIYCLYMSFGNVSYYVIQTAFMGIQNSPTRLLF